MFINIYRTLLAYLFKKAPPKGEFEKTEDYKERIAGSLPRDVYAFQIEEELSIPLKYYDADSEKMFVKIRTDPLLSLKTSDRRPALVIKISKKNKRLYQASNAFGKKIMVTQYSGIRYALSLLNYQDFGEERSTVTWLRAYEVDFYLSIPEAKALKENLGVMVICKMKLPDPSEPFLFEGFNHFGPTIENPIEMSFNTKYLTVDILEIWLYNSATGKVFHKGKLKKDEPILSS